MNKHTRLFAGFLISIFVLLVGGNISFSVGISKKSKGNQSDDLDTSIRIGGNEVFQDENDLYGVRDENGNTLVTADWVKLRFLNADYLAVFCTAESATDGEPFGVLDLNGNLVAPFVYQNVQVLFSTSFLAEFADEESYVLYDSNFQPVSAVVWDSYTLSETAITLINENDSFVYTNDEEKGLLLTDVHLQRSINNTTITITQEMDTGVDSISADAWIYVATQFQQMLNIMTNNDDAAVLEITDEENADTIAPILVWENRTILRIDRNATVIVTTEEGKSPILTWQIDMNIRLADEGQKKQTLIATMEQNQNEVWIVTDVQLQ
ncbi:MAG: hypothetical protein LIO74_10620 [Ruminococcus sp.]|nr:hypothetical protein [Ruminococcus sp.]